MVYFLHHFNLNVGFLVKDRRELLKVLGVAGATGAVWKKPVVDAVSLPAHAVTSCTGGCYKSGDNQDSGSSIFWDEIAEEIRFHSDVVDCSNEAKATYDAIVSEAQPTDECGLWDTLDNVAVYDGACTVWFCDQPL